MKLEEGISGKQGGKVPMQHFQTLQSIQVFSSTHQLQSEKLLHLHLQRHCIGPVVRQQPYKGADNCKA